MAGNHSEVFTVAQRREFKKLLERHYGSAHLMDRKGGQLAVKCHNPKCTSISKGKLKLEYNLPTGLYSCWTCGERGRISPSSWFLRGRPSGNQIVDWLRQNDSYYARARKSVEGSGGGVENWKKYMVDALNRIAAEDDEFSDVYGVQEFVDRESLPSEMLALLPRSNVAWKHWTARWGSRANSDLPLAMAWKYDVRVKWIYNSPVYGFPAYNADGVLTGIHWWNPTYHIRYRSEGDRALFVLAEHTIDWGSPLYLVEGVWDAMHGGHNAVPLLGSTIPSHARIRDLIWKHRPPHVYVVLDHDATKKAWRVAKKVDALDVPVSVVCPPKGKDPADLESEIVCWMKKNSINPTPYGWQGELISSLVEK